MVDNQNYGYRIMADAVATVLQDRYMTVEPRSWTIGASLLLALIVGLAVYGLGFRAAIIATVDMLGLYYVAAIVTAQRDLLIDPLDPSIERRLLIRRLAVEVDVDGIRMRLGVRLARRRF